MGLTPKSGLLLLDHSEGMGRSALSASTDFRSCDLRRKDEEKRHVLQTVLGFANTPYCWDMADSGHCSRGIIRPARFREVGRRSWGARCQYPAPYSFSPPQHTCTHCQVWVQWTEMLDLEIKIPFPWAMLFKDHPSGSASPLVPESSSLLLGALLLSLRLMNLVCHVPTCSSSEKQPPIPCLLHCKMLYQ